MPRQCAYSIDELRKAVANSTSFAQVLSHLGLRPAGGNYKYLKERLQSHQIDYSHFSYQAWAKGKTLGPRRELADYLAYPPAYKISTFALKRRLLQEGVFQPCCSSCLLVSWLGVPIPLELDHINGVNQDNRLENLRLLCPNCHALTATYRGKNKQRPI